MVNYGLVIIDLFEWYVRQDMLFCDVMNLRGV